MVASTSYTCPEGWMALMRTVERRWRNQVMIMVVRAVPTALVAPMKAGLPIMDAAPLRIDPRSLLM